MRAWGGGISGPCSGNRVAGAWKREDFGRVRRGESKTGGPSRQFSAFCAVSHSASVKLSDGLRRGRFGPEARAALQTEQGSPSRARERGGDSVVASLGECAPGGVGCVGGSRLWVVLGSCRSCGAPFGRISRVRTGERALRVFRWSPGASGEFWESPGTSCRAFEHGSFCRPTFVLAGERRRSAAALAGVSGCTGLCRPVGPDVVFTALAPDSSRYSDFAGRAVDGIIFFDPNSAPASGSGSGGVYEFLCGRRQRKPVFYGERGRVLGLHIF